MRNKYAGNCFRCGKRVWPGEGHFQRHKGSWLVVCLDCVDKHRAEKEAKEKAKWGY
jgi:ribosome-binding protein aMBF1 (putative translation factor)